VTYVLVEFAANIIEGHVYSEGIVRGINKFAAYRAFLCVLNQILQEAHPAETESYH